MAPCFAGRNERRQPVFTLVGEWTLQEVRPMRVSDRLRDRAERLRALAVRAREDGNVALSDERLAAESSDHEDGSHAPDKVRRRHGGMLDCAMSVRGRSTWSTQVLATSIFGPLLPETDICCAGTAAEVFPQTLPHRGAMLRSKSFFGTFRYGYVARGRA